jgi:hypothetical protein
MVNSNGVADSILHNLQEILGPTVFDVLMGVMAGDYFGERNVRMAIIERPEVFESAFVKIVGEEVGQKILAKIFHEIRVEFQIDGRFTYSKSGDFARCMAMLPRA